MRARLESRRLRAMIRDSRISQNHWALRLGISRGHLSDLVNGHHRFPSARVRERLLEGFDVPFDALFVAEPADSDGHLPDGSSPDDDRRDVRALAAIAFDTLASRHRESLPPAVEALRRRGRQRQRDDPDDAYRSPEAFLRALTGALDSAREAPHSRRRSTRPPRRLPTMDDLWRDLRFAVRTLAKAPGLAGLMALTLALGVGATTVMFSLIDGVLTRPLPYPDEDRLMLLREKDPEGRGMWASYANFADWRAGASDFEAMAATTWPRAATVPGADGPTRASIVRVTSDYFRVAALEPHLGRFIEASENRPGGPAVAVVSHGFWHRVLGAPASLAGVTVPVEGEIFEVVGVAPPGFSLLGRPDVWLPLDRAVPWTTRGNHVIPVIGRLRPQADAASAARALDAIGARIAEHHGAETVAVGVVMEPFKRFVVGTAVQPLSLLMAAAVLLLVVACANVASGLLARGVGRRQELMTRAALGAGRGRLVRQLMTENALLAFLGAAAGALGATLLVAWLKHAAPSALPRLELVAVDLRALGFTVGVAASSLLLFGLLPALPMVAGRRATALAPGSGDRGSGHRGTHHRRAVWRWLIGGQIAVALVLLCGAGLLVHSLWQILSTDVGYRADGVLTATVDLPATDEADRAEVVARMVASLAAMPAVSDAGLASHLPLDAGNFVGPVTVDGRDDGPVAHYRIADAGYFTTLGIPLLRGRLFDHRDRGDAPHVAVINRSLAERYWPGRDPIGETFRIDGMDPYRDQPLTVIGVVGEARSWRLAAGGQLEYYVALPQRPALGRTLNVVLRAQGRPGGLVDQARAQIRAVAPAASVTFEALDRRLADSTADRRLAATVLLALGLMALTLAAAGVYGVFAYAVALRRQEMGIRLALGAVPGQLVRLVVGDAARTLAWGLAAGLIGTFGFTRLLRHQLVDTRPLEPMVLAIAVAALVAVGLLASWIPALRARRIDPARTIRAD